MGGLVDEFVISNKKRKQIMDSNDAINRCPACSLGYIFIIDPVESIGQCNYCFEEFKLFLQGLGDKK